MGVGHAMRRMRSGLAVTTAALALTAAPAWARDSGDTILVVDASNSMWGQIDGTAKIEIARTALADYVRSMAPDTRLGLFAYGHREVGRCDDIQQVRALGRLDADAVIDDVNGLVPRGRTPLTDAVRAAADALGPDGGTVILLTDGVETCGGDPCAMAAELAASGVQLTTHVVGFDIRTPGDRASLACIADQTGGTYVDASDGAELVEALRTAAAAEPRGTAQMRSIELTATLGEGGPVIDDAVFFVVDTGAGSVIADGIPGPADLMPGHYRVVALTGEGNGALEVGVSSSGPRRITVVVAAALPEASVALEGAAEAGRIARFSWDGPDGTDDYLQLAGPAGEALEATYSAWTRDGDPAEIRMPGEAGEYSVQYIHAGPNRVLASSVFTVEPALATIETDAVAEAGSTLSVRWTGPDQAGDWIGFVPPGGLAGDLVGQAYGDTADSESGALAVPVPGTTGAFELIYVLSSDGTVLARQAVEVTEAGASLDAPDTAEAGGVIEVGYSGPGGEGDWIAVVPAGSPSSDYLNNAWGYVRGGQATLRVPVPPGAYEVRYIQDAADGMSVLAARPLTVSPPSATIDAPASVAAGETFTVTATGPLQDDDYIDFALPGTPAGDYSLGWSRVAPDGTAAMVAPETPGTYRLRYIVSIDGTHILYEGTIDVR